MTRDSKSGIRSHEGRVLIDPSTPEGLYALTESGDFAAADFALWVFCKSVREGDVPPQDILEYLEDGFTQYLEGRASSIDKALIPTKERHRPRRLLTFIRDFGLARQVVHLMAANETLEKAKAQVALGTPGVSESTIEQAYKKYRLYVSEMP